MPIINHINYNNISDMEAIITQNDGCPLYGEIDMFRRIFADCYFSGRIWHFWHDLRLPIPVKRVRIDSLLSSEKGVVIAKVKGEKIGIEQGVNCYEASMERTFTDRTPFEQTSDYKYALMRNKIISSSILSIETVCAFPHTLMEYTYANPNADLGNI